MNLLILLTTGVSLIMSCVQAAACVTVISRGATP